MPENWLRNELSCLESIQVYLVHACLKFDLNGDFDVINERLKSYYA